MRCVKRFHREGIYPCQGMIALDAGEDQPDVRPAGIAALAGLGLDSGAMRLAIAVVLYVAAYAYAIVAALIGKSGLAASAAFVPFTLSPLIGIPAYFRDLE
jgi:hypothetical protein